MRLRPQEETGSQGMYPKGITYTNSKMKGGDRKERNAIGGGTLLPHTGNNAGIKKK